MDNFSYKLLVRKSLVPIEMLWVELKMLYQPERNTKQSNDRKGQTLIFSGAELPRPIKSYILETSWITIEVKRKHFFLYLEVMGQCDPIRFSR